MLEEIMNHTGGKITREKAVEILKAEADSKWYHDWYLAVHLILFGIIASSFGTESLIIYLGLAAAISAVNYRNKLRTSSIARAALLLLSETDQDH